MHLYYFPIILLAYHYRRRGFYLSSLLALSYLGLVWYYFPANPGLIFEAAIRVVVLVGIAALVAYFAARLVRTQKETRRDADILESSLMNANVLLMLLDARGRVLIWNTAAERITGYPAGELLGRNDAWKLLYPEKEYRDGITAKITKIIGEDNFFENLETTIRCRNGESKIISWNTRMIPDPADGGNRFIAIGTDITERTRAEKALQESEARFKGLFDHMGSGVAVYGAVEDGDDFVFRDFNRAAEKIEGMPKADLVGKRVTQAFPGVRELGLFRVLQRVWKTGIPEYLPEALYRDERDRGSWRENWVYRLPTGEIVALYNDITERKRAEDAVKDSEEKFRVIFDNASDGMFLVDLKERRFFMMNAASARMLGYGKEEFSGLDIASLHAPEDLPFIYEQIARYSRGEEGTRSDIRFRRRDGTF
ncbi:MAG TPA: PAS domain S-box protein, partial [Methanomicrobiales archaeon]|nr:PAS domain S-box protein [Methanomicrobiales archaeon]